jgi:hypothetical protein
MLNSSVLASIESSWVRFDPSIPEHRESAYTYLKTRSWKHATIRFVVDYPFSNIVTQITTQLSQYYTDKEFASVSNDNS